MAGKRKSGPAQTGAPQSGAFAGADNLRQNYYFAALMFVIAVFTLWYFELPLNFDVTSPDFNPITFFPVIIAGIGGVMLVRNVFASARAGKFGEATLSPNGAARGTQFRPVMRTVGDIETTGDFVFTLKCLRKTRRGDDFDRPSSSEKTIWKHSETSPAAGRSSQGVGASFLIPADVQPSRGGGKDDPDDIRWVLGVSAPVKGVNFYAEFGITVR